MASQTISGSVGDKPSQHQELLSPSQPESGKSLEHEVGKLTEAFRQTSLSRFLVLEDMAALERQPLAETEEAYGATLRPQTGQLQVTGTDLFEDGSTNVQWNPWDNKNCDIGRSTSGKMSPNVDTPRDIHKQQFRSQFSKTKWCCFIETGCMRGDQCDFAHTVEELMFPPDLSKTSICKLWEVGRCPNPKTVCLYAHGRHELRVTPQFRKQTMCKQFAHGLCSLDKDCRHAHSVDECRFPSSRSSAGMC